MKPCIDVRNYFRSEAEFAVYVHDLSRHAQQRKQCRDVSLSCYVQYAWLRESWSQAVGVKKWVVRKGEVDECISWKIVDDIEDQFRWQSVEWVLRSCSDCV